MTLCSNHHKKVNRTSKSPKQKLGLGKKKGFSPEAVYENLSILTKLGLIEEKKMKG